MIYAIFLSNGAKMINDFSDITAKRLSLSDGEKVCRHILDEQCRTFVKLLVVDYSRLPSAVT
jgi:hypothetical protein